MKKNKIKELFAISFATPLILGLSACGKSPEYEYLPEECRSYDLFVDEASEDLFKFLKDEHNGISRENYYTKIGEIQRLEVNADNAADPFDFSGIGCFTSINALDLSGPGIKDIGPLSKLTSVQEISIHETRVSSIKPFLNYSMVTDLSLVNNPLLSDVSGIENMTQLTSLILPNNGITQDYVEGFSALENLVTLDLTGNNITDFGPLGAVPNLETLILDDNSITGVTVTAGDFSNLETLSLARNGLDGTTLTDVGQISSLESLNLNHNSITDLNFLSTDTGSLTNLVSLSLQNNGFTDLSTTFGVVVNPTTSITNLDLSNNPGILTVSGLNNYNSITTLDLSVPEEWDHDFDEDTADIPVANGSLVDITGLELVTSLSSLNLSRNSVNDFANIVPTLTNLQVLNLSDNDINSIPIINGTGLTSLETLDLSKNNISVLNNLENHSTLETLSLVENPITDINDFSGLSSLDTLDFGSNTEDLTQVKTITNSFNNLNTYAFNQGDLSFNFTTDTTNKLAIVNSFKNLAAVTGDINLTSENIQLIDSTSFDLNVSNIDLSGNLISNIDFVNNIDGYTSIDLSNNSITGVNNVFNNVPTLLAVDLSSNSITSLTDSFNTVQNLDVIDLSGSTIDTLDNSFTNIKLGTFNVSFGTGASQTISDSFNYVADLNSLDISNLSVSAIDNSFNNIDLDFTANSIGLTSVTGSFNNTDGTIDLSSNSISAIDNSSFNSADLDSLTINNNTVSLPLNFLSVSGSEPLIDVLEATNSNINVANFAHINNANQIVTLTLSNNAINSITFSETLSSVETLNLSSNGITSLTGIDLPNVTSIILSGNAITTIDNSFNSITSLNNLTISGMNINSITNSFNNSTFATIDISSNSAALNINNSFKNSNITATLDLSGSTGLTISGGSFTGLDVTNGSNDAQLNLSNTSINDANLSLFANLGNVNVLNIPNINDTDTLFDQLFDNTSLRTSVVELYINGNNSLTTINKIQYFSQLRVLNASGTNITVLDGILNSANNLETLTLPTGVTTINNSFNVFSNTLRVNGNNFDTNSMTIFGSVTSITNSFNDTDIDEVTLYNNNYTITGSFNDVATLKLHSSTTVANFSPTSSFNNINRLELRNSNMSNTDLQSLLTNLGKTKLTDINLSGYSIDITSTLDFFNNNNTLINVDLSNSSFNDISGVFNNSTSLRRIALENNTLTNVHDSFNNLSAYISNVNMSSTSTSLRGTSYQNAYNNTDIGNITFRNKLQVTELGVSGKESFNNSNASFSLTGFDSSLTSVYGLTGVRMTTVNFNQAFNVGNIDFLNNIDQGTLNTIYVNGSPMHRDYTIESGIQSEMESGLTGTVNSILISQSGDGHTDYNSLGVRTITFNLQKGGASYDFVRNMTVEDTTAPTAPHTGSITAGTLYNGWYTDSITYQFTVGTDSGSGVIEYRWRVGGASWTYEATTAGAVETLTFNSDITNQMLEIQTVDNANNWSSNLTQVLKLDKTAPSLDSINLDSSWLNYNPTATFSTSDAGSNIASRDCSIDGGTSWNPCDFSSSHTIVVSGGTSVSNDFMIRITDNAGNVYTSTSYNYRVDKVAPTLPTYSGVNGGLYNTDKTFTFGPGSDADSDIDRVEYSINNTSSWQTYTGTVTLSVDGTYEIFVKITDNAGNVTTSTLLETVTIDKTNPTLPNFVGITDGHFNTDQTFTLDGTESDLNGPTSVEYSIDGGSTWIAYSADVTLSTNGTYELMVRVTDAATNVNTSTVLYTVTIDKANPTAPTLNGVTDGEFLNGPLNLTLSGGTDTNAFTRWYNIDGNGWTQGDSLPSISAEGSHTVEFKTIDQAGNESSVSSVSFTIDDTGPSSTLDGNTTVANGTLFDLSDNFSANGDITIDVVGGTPVATLTDGEALTTAGSYTVDLTDEAGNTTRITFTVLA